MLHHNKKRFMFIFIFLFCATKIAQPHDFNHAIITLAAHHNFTAKEPIQINRIACTCDIPFSNAEFYYLTNLHENTIITLADLDRAYSNLVDKKRFNSIEFVLNKTPQGHNLHVTLKAQWIFKQVKIHGIWFGKNQYENLYLQHAGDVFDISLHEESLCAVKQLLYEQGYFFSTIDDEIIYNAKDKTITVKLNLKLRINFRIDRLDFEVIGIDAQESRTLAQTLKSMFEPILIKQYYRKKLLTKVRTRITEHIQKLGFLHHKIELKRRINAERKRVSLLFCVTLKPKYQFVFYGNKFFSSNDLQQKIIGQQQPEWLLSPELVTEQLLREYYKKGFWNAQISYKKIKKHHYEYTIQEGDRTRINTVILKDALSSKEEKNKLFFHELLSARYYDETVLTACLEKLKQFYVDHGFWNFSVLDQQFSKNSVDENLYTLIITTKKGAQKFLDHVSIEHFPELEKEPPFNLYSTTPEATIPFNPHMLQEQHSHILDHFQKQGYWYVDAQPTMSVSTLTTSKKSNRTLSEIIDITWTVTPGEQVMFDKIFLRGSTKLPFQRIMKEIECKEGEPFDRKKLDYTRKKLKTLDIFKHIQIQPQKLALPQNKKPVLITLLDDDPLEFKLRAGYYLTSKNFLLKRDSTPKIGGSIIFKNPLNSADKLMLNADFSRFERNFDLDYQIPRPLDTSFIGKSKLYSHKYIHPLEVGKCDSAYEAIQNGFLLGMTKEFKPFSYWGINVGNEWSQTTRARGNLNLAANMINTTIPYFFIEPSIVIDQLDDKLQTTKGSLTFFSLKAMIPETNRSTTFKIMLERSMFHPITKNIVGGLRLRWGHIFRQHFDQIMPIERFFLGGPSSIRGYSKDTVPPLGTTIKTDAAGNETIEYTIQGGSSMLNGNVEIRFPIYKSFGGVLFQDIGVLSQSGFCGLKHRWYPASGFGLRYQTPIGAFRFDIGWKWKKSFPTDTSYAWYLTLGQTF